MNNNNNSTSTREGELILDSHKLSYHFERVESWENGEKNGVFAYSLSKKESFIQTIIKLHELDSNEFEVLSNNAYNYAKNKIDFDFLKKQYINLYSKYVKK